MPRGSPDSTSGRSPDSPNREVHLTPRIGSGDPRLHRFDAVVAAFVAACRAQLGDPNRRALEGHATSGPTPVGRDADFAAAVPTEGRHSRRPLEASARNRMTASTR